MNSRYIKRIVTSTALIALCVVSAAMFLTGIRTKLSAKPATVQGAAALEQLKQNGQYESLQVAMQQARFGVSRVEQSPLGRSAWHAPNPAAGYDAYVTETGVNLAVKDAPPVSLSLHSLGYGDELQTVTPGQVSGDQQAITIERENIREWFVNGADGLEHGFTLDERPHSAVRNPHSALRLALQVGAGWRAAANADGQSVTLHGARNQIINYGKLAVRDRAGHDIPAKLTVANEQVVIEVEDHDAQYPLTIDPLFTLQKQLLANDGAAGDYLGYAVALDGNTALVGAPYDDNKRGAAYIFVRNGALWSQQAKLLAQDGTSFDYFGQSVALKGDTAVVGATYGPGDLHPEQGAAYVFVRGGNGTWSLQKRLNANERTVGAQFGAAVALDGDTVIIGAPTYTITPSFADIGVVFIFTRSGGNWTQQARLNANDGEDGDSFGVTVALEGDTALVGAPNNAVTAGGQGAAYVFTRNGTNWTQRQRLLTNSAPDDHFGSAVALNGDKALIGAPGSDLSATVTDCGSVYDFRRGASSWTQSSQFFASSNPTAGAQFGVSLALSGDTLVVGASRGLFQPGADQRSAYVFVYGGEWFPVRHLGPELGAANDGFGYAVALSGDTVLVGAYRGDAAAIDQGAAYAFVLHDSLHVEQPKLTSFDGADGDDFGWSVALDGDTLVVGAQRDDIGTKRDQGSVYVFTRNGAGQPVWTFQQKLTANDGAELDYFGYSVAIHGDTLAVGVPYDDIGTYTNQGSAYVFTRSGTTWTQQQKLFAIAIDGLPNDRFGWSVALGGHTVAVGAVGVNGDGGAVYVFMRNGTAWTQQQKIIAADGTGFDRLGSSVALFGDTLAAGAPFDKIGMNFNQGSAYVFTRSGATWTEQRKLTANDGAAEDYFGQAVALHGDTLAVGAPAFSTNRPGAAYVFARSGTAWSQFPKLAARDSQLGAQFGASVALGGDTLVVGAERDNIGTNVDQGAAYVFTRLGNWVQQQKLIAGDGAPNDYFGNAVALSGDTIAVGSYSDDIGANTQQGSAYVFVAPRCPAITIAPGSLPNGVLNAAYNQPLTESGGPGETPLSVSCGALPPGLRLSIAPGLLSGTPTVAGTYRFTITATLLPSGCTGSREYTLTITQPCPTITVTPPTLPNGTVGAAYSQIITGTGGTDQHTVAHTAGTLPPGLSFNPNGLLSGTPTQAGSYTFTIMAESAGCTGTRTYTLTITAAACPTITLNPASLPNATVGVAYSQQLTATGGTAPYSFAVTAGGLPGGVNLASDGALTGAPGTSGIFNFTIRATDANGCQGTRAYSVTINGGGSGATGLQFYPLAHPVRLLDTRAGAPGCDAPGAMIAGQTSRTQTAAGRTCDGLSIPANAKALTGNITTVQSGGGYLTLYPSDAAQPNVANSNYTPNQILNNVFTVGLGAGDGAFKIFVTSNTNVVVDVTGYYAPPAAGGLYFHPLPKPIRLLETRQGQPGCQATNSQLQANSTRTQLGITTCDNVTIPAGAQALVGNATTVGPQTGGWLTFYPADAAQPLVASSNFLAGDVMNAPFTVGLSPSGEFKVFTTSTTDLVVDVVGYYSTQVNDTNGQGLLFNSLPAPVRLLDTRAGFSGCYTPGAKMTGGTTYTQAATGACMNIPATAKAVVGSAAVVTPSGGGWLTFGPSSAPLPFVAASNYLTGQIFNRHFIVGLGADGAFKRYSFATTDLVIDLSGYFAP